MTFILIAAIGAFVALAVAVNARFKKGDSTEMSIAGQFGEILTVGGLLLAAFLWLWDTAMKREGYWWAIFTIYVIVGAFVGFKTKRRLDALVRTSKALKSSDTPNHSSDPALSSVTSAAVQPPLTGPHLLIHSE